MEITIHIGEYYGSAEPVIIKTLLGSCVSVCLFDPVRKIGAMNHIFLPGRADLKHFDVKARFGINAMELLINEMLKLGADRQKLIAKTFGGAHILSEISKTNSQGRKISEFVTEFLKNESIRLIGHDLGGNQWRQVRFHTDTGDAFVRRIKASQFRKIVTEEQEAAERVKKIVEKPGPITLFGSAPK
jgi:chemotaxis protein CheD